MCACCVSATSSGSKAKTAHPVDVHAGGSLTTHVLSWLCFYLLQGV
jgi:hypothetical protein